MDGAGLFFASLGFVMHEALLFAACGFLLLGASDLAVDAIWIGKTLKRRLGRNLLCADNLPAPREPGLIAIFIPAWDESAVIAEMLTNTIRTFGPGDYLIFVGTYPNDPATIAAVRSVADPRIRLIIGPVPGPTTKADCLNRLWEALLREEEESTGQRAKAIVLHDAEDLVHSAELRIFDRLVEEHDLIQLPVLPLVDEATFVSKSYADEFAESHGKELVVRQALGASIPSAGVGCAFARDALASIAAQNGGMPFEADSLTEDYELGLKLYACGARSVFVRLRSSRKGAVVATKEYFPGTVKAAVNQRARWMTGIALAGWNRLGWTGGLAERWMRLRDRQSVLAAILLCAAYLAFILWGVLQTRAIAIGVPLEPVSKQLRLLLQVNLAMLAWRLTMRVAFVTRAYGWQEGLGSVPRVVVSNLISVWAAQRAVYRYLAIRRTGRTSWDKTAHRFPAEIPAE